jgi:hypothetical protein
MPHDPELSAHLEWLGYIQPVGLVVSPPALVQAQAHINRNVIPQHQRFLACLPMDANDEPIAVIRDFPQLVREVLDWQDSDLIAFEQAARSGHDVAGLEVVLPEYNETLRPTWIVPEFIPKHSAGNEPPSGTNAGRWVLLIQQIADSQDLDEPLEESDRRWHASPHARFERLLRETQVPAGLLTNGRQLRLVYAPRGETSGYLTFDVAAMITVAGRPIFAALHMLLNADRLFNLEKSQRLPAILVESRKYQNTVSTQLAQQVMAALYELLRGFQAADDQWNGRLLQDVLATNPQHVYHGLLTVLMRTVFVLYAEDRNLLSSHPVYTNYYAIIGLFERLRSDAGQYPDTMDQRYGAWAQLLSLFRMIYEGGSHAELQIPPRKGYLFDPSRYPFLEGRGVGPVGMGTRAEETASVPTLRSPTTDPRPPIPRVSDGVVYRVLNNLLILDGERLSYRSLDVEQIGSVYEAIMGFEVRVSTGRSIAIRPVKKHGAPATINLEELLGQKAAERAKWLKDRTDQSITGQTLETLRTAMSIDDLLAALDRKIDNLVTPNVVPANSMIFQPSDERRRSGSHYTPRSFTEPVVRTTLRPILEALGPHPRPEQILGLKVCDPAMGSGAFLVEVCRQLAEALVAAWYFHDCVPQFPPDEDDLLHARRLVAQRCLYGVDKNPMAVDLAKLSLWLVTLAKDHPFTFVDHSLRAGDSLVGLTREQIVAFTWQPVAAGTGLRREKKGKKKTAAVNQPSDTAKLFSDPIADRMRKVSEYRQRILAARDDRPYEQLRQELDVADEALSLARLAGDCVIAAFFSAEKDRERVANLGTLSRQLVLYLAPQSRIEDRQPLAAAVASLINGDHPLQPFHWQIEFPEVFTIDSNGEPTGGFDAIVGNPPFAGKNTLINGNRDGYLDWLKTLHEESHGNADLVAHFFRRAFNLLRPEGCFGLIATNTICQGDTRATALRWICKHYGTIYSAVKRAKWPGQAAVVVSVVNACRGQIRSPYSLDGKDAPMITAYLYPAGSHEDPKPLLANAQKSFIGSYVLGMGFTFDDNESNGVATTITEMKRLIDQNPRNRERIFPYIGGEEVNDSPSHSHRRYIINFEFMTEDNARAWPDLIKIVEVKVKPERLRQKDKIGRERWWLFLRQRPELYESLAGKSRTLVVPRVTQHIGFAFLPTGMVLSEQLVVIPTESDATFAVLQSTVHEVWARFFGSSLEERFRYTPSDCFETFPFPITMPETIRKDALPLGGETHATLNQVGSEYYAFRASLMIDCAQGLTQTYNRFHDPHESSPEILQLRDLHAAMDRAVLEAYGWHDLAESATCDFLLEYEDEEDDDGASSGRRRKKPWRLRWPDEFRDEVLARLLELNEQRHKEEVLAAKAVSGRRVASGGDEGDDEAESLDDTEDRTEPTPRQTAAKKTAKPKSPRKSKKSPAAGQQEMEF